jgi:hypothetical protein
MVIIPASYLEHPGFKSLFERRLSWLKFLWLLSVLPRKILFNASIGPRIILKIFLPFHFSLLIPLHWLYTSVIYNVVSYVPLLNTKFIWHLHLFHEVAEKIWLKRDSVDLYCKLMNILTQMRFSRWCKFRFCSAVTFHGSWQIFDTCTSPIIWRFNRAFLLRNVGST